MASILFWRRTSSSACSFTSPSTAMGSGTRGSSKLAGRCRVPRKSKYTIDAPSRIPPRSGEMPRPRNQLEIGSVSMGLPRPHAAALDHTLGLDALDLTRGGAAVPHLKEQPLALFVVEVALLAHQAIGRRL